jgi:hypothetical protein
MSPDELRALIWRLREEHANDDDGGYGLVAAYKQAQQSLDTDSAEQFVEVLADLVRIQDPEISAVALEALVQIGASQAIAALAGELTKSIRDEGRKDYLVLGLLRATQRQIAEPILDHIRSSLENPRPLTVPIIAALCSIDRDTGLDISCAYFEKALFSGQMSSVEASIAAFVRNFVAIDDRLLPELVRMLRVRKPETGRWLSDRICEYLSKPWMIEELGGDRCTRIRAKIAAAELALN